MAITEDARHRLYRRLEEVLGNEEATTLMEQLGHVSWTELATKRDLDLLRLDLDRVAVASKRDIDQALEAQTNRLRYEFEHGLRLQALALFAANSTVAGLLIAAATLV